MQQELVSEQKRVLVGSMDASLHSQTLNAIVFNLMLVLFLFACHPLGAVTSILPLFLSHSLYFMSNLRREPGNFFLFVLIKFVYSISLFLGFHSCSC
jgi:hypothetical protein